MSSRGHKSWHWLWLSLVIIVIDQTTKLLCAHFLTYNQPVAILPFLNFTLRFNQGAAYGFLGNSAGWQIYLLAAVSLWVSTLLFFWLGRIKRSDVWLAGSVSLILGGASGISSI